VDSALVPYVGTEKRFEFTLVLDLEELEDSGLYSGTKGTEKRVDFSLDSGTVS
jgi:hypothetical protein